MLYAGDADYTASKEWSAFKGLQYLYMLWYLQILVQNTVIKVLFTTELYGT